MPLTQLIAVPRHLPSDPVSQRPVQRELNSCRQRESMTFSASWRQTREVSPATFASTKGKHICRKQMKPKTRKRQSREMERRNHPHRTSKPPTPLTPHPSLRPSQEVFLKWDSRHWKLKELWPVYRVIVKTLSKRDPRKSSPEVGRTGTGRNRSGCGRQ